MPIDGGQVQHLAEDGPANQRDEDDTSRREPKMA